MWIPVFVSAAVLLYLYNAGSSNNIKIGQHFTLAELTNTSTGIQNTPDELALNNLSYLVRTVLDPLRNQVGPLIVTSGYRSHDVNEAVGGSASSQHMKGEAADVVPTSSSKDAAVDALRNLPVDQVITYENTTHIHVSATENGNRGEFLHYKNGSYQWMS